MAERNWKALKVILLIGTVLAALKMIFFDYTLDEEYQIVMAYRSISGDSLFVQMWEPHQTSAFLCAFLMRLYYMVTGTYTAVIIWLRVCTTLIQIALAYYVYRVLGGSFEKRIAFLAALIYFNVVPKNIQIPEFANMQLWFFTLIILLLIQYFSGWYSKKKWNVCLLVLASVSMFLEVLSYPSCVILFPFFLVYIFRKSGAHRWRDCILFAGTCGLCALVWLAAILRNISFSDFVRNAGYILEFDSTHDISGISAGKFEKLVSNLRTGFLLIVLILIVSAGFYFALNAFRQKRGGTSAEHRDKYKKITEGWRTVKSGCELSKSTQAEVLIFCVICVVVSEMVQLFSWIILQTGYELTHIHFVVIFLSAAVAWRYAGQQKDTLFVGIIGSEISLAAVFYISDLELYNAMPHAWLGVLFCLLVLVGALQNTLGTGAKRWILTLLISICLVCLVGKGFILRAGRNYETVLQTGGMMKYGPAAGILTNYMNAYIYNSNYEDFEAYMEDDDRVLIVTNMVISQNTTAYLFKDVEICHYSIVDPTSYDERLLTYWELYPEKKPNVIIVDCWYGVLYEAQDSWIMQYIENEFDYTGVTDGKYIRFYRS